MCVSLSLFSLPLSGLERFILVAGSIRAGVGWRVKQQRSQFVNRLSSFGIFHNDGHLVQAVEACAGDRPFPTVQRKSFPGFTLCHSIHEVALSTKRLDLTGGDQ